MKKNQLYLVWYLASIDIINALHKEDLCYDFVLSEIKAICPPRTVIDEQSPGFIAEQFGIWCDYTLIAPYI